jgi:hypothetical protein
LSSILVKLSQCVHRMTFLSGARVCPYVSFRLPFAGTLTPLLQWPDIRTSRNKWVHTLNKADVVRSADAFFVFCPQSSSFPCYYSRSHSTRSRNRLTGRWDLQLSHEFVGGRRRVFRFPFASRFCRFYFQSADLTYNRTICPTGLDHLVIFLACRP